MTFTEIQTEVAARLNLTSAEALARIGRLINLRYKRLTTSLNLITSRRAVVQANASIGSDLITFAGEKIANIVDRTTTPYRVLKEVTMEYLRSIQPTSEGAPTMYAMMSTTASTVTVLTDCVAQTAYTLYADVHQNLSTLSGAQIPVIPESYHDILVYGVLADEYRKLMKRDLAKESDDIYKERLSDLRFFLVRSSSLELTQGGNKKQVSSTGVLGAGGGSSVNGALSWTQTGLITFDRTSAVPGARYPFAVAVGSEMVANLDAQYLGGHLASYFAVAGAALALHATTHKSGGSDSIKLDEFAAPTDVVTLNASATAHGLMKKLSNSATDFFDGSGNFDTVKDSDLALTDIATNDASSSKHGFLPKTPGNAATYLNGANPPAYVANPITTYTATLADITNSAAQTSFLSFTVGANEMLDGDVIEILFAVLLKNNKGTVGTMEIDAFWGATNVRSTDGAGGFAWSDSATERSWLYRYTMMRVINDLWIFGPQTSTSVPIDQINGSNPTLYSGAVKMTPTFSSSATVALKGTLSAANAAFYWKVQKAKVRRTS